MPGAQNSTRKCMIQSITQGIYSCQGQPAHLTKLQFSIREQNRRWVTQTNTNIMRKYRLLIHVSCASPSFFWTSSWFEASPQQQSVPASSDLQPVSRQHLQQVNHTWSPDVDVLCVKGHIGHSSPALYTTCSISSHGCILPWNSLACSDRSCCRAAV